MHNTYLLTPWCRVLLEKLTGLQPVKKFPTFYGTRRFITALTSVRHLSLSWASPIQSTYPHSTSWRSILILYTNLRLDLPNGLFPSGFPTKTLYAPLSSPIRHTCPAHLILLHFITRTMLDEENRSFSSSAEVFIISKYVTAVSYMCIHAHTHTFKLVFMQQRVLPLCAVTGLCKQTELSTETRQLLHDPLTYLNDGYKTLGKDADSGPTTFI